MAKSDHVRWEFGSSSAFLSATISDQAVNLYKLISSTADVKFDNEIQVQSLKQALAQANSLRTGTLADPENWTSSSVQNVSSKVLVICK